MKVTANAVREGGWWTVEVSEIPGLFTQARRLDQVPAMVAEAADLLGHPDVDVDVVPALDGDDAELVASATARRAALREAEAAAAVASRKAVARLRSEGLSVRDVATIMGISPQRVSVLAS